MQEFLPYNYPVGENINNNLSINWKQNSKIIIHKNI